MDIENEIQSWIAVRSFAVEDANPQAPIIDANELAEFVTEVFKKLEGCVVVPEAEFAILPKTITPEIEEILGMPCFKFIKAAQIYRQLGFDVPPKAEKEQSFFMFKFLHLALIHGDKCFDVFESETKAMLEAARGGK